MLYCFFPGYWVSLAPDERDGLCSHMSDRHLPAPIYMAEHYATDILAGAAIGMFITWLANIIRIRKPLTAWALRLLEIRPGWFYSALSS